MDTCLSLRIFKKRNTETEIHDAKYMFTLKSALGILQLSLKSALEECTLYVHNALLVLECKFKFGSWFMASLLAE